MGRANATTTKQGIRTCFISAPAGEQLSTLRAVLHEKGVQVLVPQDLSIGTDWAAEMQNQIRRADLVIGVLSAEKISPWVLFELGQASVLGQQCILVIPPNAPPVPFALNQFLVLHVEPDNKEALSFALDQVLAAAERHRSKQPRMRRAKLTGLGDKADQLLIQLDPILSRKDWTSLERLVESAIRDSGAELIVASPTPDRGFDFAVWSDVLEPFVGNPLAIEVKFRLRGAQDVLRVTEQIRSYIGRTGSRWVLLLYGDGPQAEDPVWSTMPFNVLALSIRSLIRLLEHQSFPEVVRDLRNQRVHGTVS